mgnify:CR=1 FL=1
MYLKTSISNYRKNDDEFTLIRTHFNKHLIFYKKLKTFNEFVEFSILSLQAVWLANSLISSLSWYLWIRSEQIVISFDSSIHSLIYFSRLGNKLKGIYAQRWNILHIAYKILTSKTSFEASFLEDMLNLFQLVVNLKLFSNIFLCLLFNMHY